MSYPKRSVADLVYGLLTASSADGEQMFIFSDSRSIYLLGVQRAGMKPTLGLAMRIAGPEVGRIWMWLEWTRSWVELRSAEDEIRWRANHITSGNLHSLVTMLIGEWRDYQVRIDELYSPLPELVTTIAEYKRVSYVGFAEKPLRALLPPSWRNVVVVSGLTASAVPLAEYPLQGLPGFALHFYLPSALPRELRGSHSGDPMLSGVGIPLRDARGYLLGEVSFQGRIPIILIHEDAENFGSWKARRLMRTVVEELTPLLCAAACLRGFDVDRLMTDLAMREIEIAIETLALLRNDVETSGIAREIAPKEFSSDLDFSLAPELGL